VRVVVCGAGTAGCVVAARLSQDLALEVTLLEVVPHYRPGRWPPALAHSHRIIKETHDWGYWCAPAPRRASSTCPAAGWWGARR
jgi:choline dehydrogenase